MRTFVIKQMENLIFINILIKQYTSKIKKKNCEYNSIHNVKTLRCN